MLGLIFACVLGVSSFFAERKWQLFGFDEPTPKMTATVLALMGLFIGGAVSASIGSQHPKEWRKVESTPIVAMRNIEGVEGSIFLGSGYVENKPIFVFWKRSEVGYQIETIHAGGTMVVEEERNDGELVKLREELLYPEKLPWYASYIPTCCRQEFHIPRGSLVRNFSLK